MGAGSKTGEGKACLNCMGPFPAYSRMPFLPLSLSQGVLQVPGPHSREVVRAFSVLQWSKAQVLTKAPGSSLSSMELSGLRGNQHRTERQGLWKRNLTSLLPRKPPRGPVRAIIARITQYAFWFPSAQMLRDLAPSVLHSSTRLDLVPTHLC